MRKSLIFAIIGFLVIIFAGFMELKYLDSLSKELVGFIDKADSLENFEEEMVIIDEFRDKWDKNKRILSMFIDHQDIHKIESELVEVETNLKNNAKKCQISTNFALLKLYIEDITEERTFILQNVL